jgi:hypothetical protein
VLWIGAFLAITTGCGVAGEDQDSISHLPEVIQRDIGAWRARLASAACLKVTVETEQVWENLHELDKAGSPALVRRERFQVHSWMTPELLWLTIYAYDGDVPNTKLPRTQMLWQKSSGIVRERYWSPADEVYHVRKYVSNEPYGPGTAIVQGSKGCVWGPGTESWLARGEQESDLCPTARTLGVFRSPSLAVIPPDTSADGVWLDIMKQRPQRDKYPDRQKLYRRNDLLLLGQSGTGLPEVRKWRTIVLTDSDNDGRTPTQIVGDCDFSYRFFDEVPSELASGTSAFAQDIDEAMRILNRGEGRDQSD